MSSKSLAKGLILGLIIGLVLGLSIGILTSKLIMPSSTENTLQPTPTYMGYTRVKVLSDGLEKVTVGGEELVFMYKWMGVSDDIRITILNSNIDRNLPPTQGATYNIAGFEIIVSEVHDDYVILYVK